MEISEVRVKLVEKSRERLQAFCSITLDGDFVIRDLKIIDGINGPFVAMPSRKLADRCPRCGYKNHLKARFCNECGAKLRENRAPRDAQGRAKLHADVAHPINSECRERIQKVLIDAYRAELEKSKAPGYKPPLYDDDYEDDDVDFETPETLDIEPVSEAKPARKGQDNFSDYNELIADLKKDAEGRRRKQDDQRKPREFAVVDSEDGNFEDSSPHPLPHREKTKGIHATSSDRAPKTDRDRSIVRQDRAADGRFEHAGGPKETPSPPGQSNLTPKNAQENDDFGAGLF